MLDPNQISKTDPRFKKWYKFGHMKTLLEDNGKSPEEVAIATGQVEIATPNFANGDDANKGTA